jgi:hypothetical protein
MSSIHLTYQAFPQFPAVAFFQQQQKNVLQAHILNSELKCSLGPRDDRAVQCSALSLEEVVRTASCDCGASWPSLERIERGGDKVMWLAENRRILL